MKKTCQNCKAEFTVEPEDFKFYEKMAVPPPTFCPECRLIRRLAWRNERTLHPRTCDKCGKDILSVYAPGSGLIVYCSPCWWSDSWEGMSYGMDFDERKPFLLQLNDLFHRVPLMNLFGAFLTLTNCHYINMGNEMKNCYFLTHSAFNENSAYGGFITHTKDSVDNFLLDHCELCYDSVNCRSCYQTLYSIDCEQCHDVYFSRNCVGCSHCFGCINLRNKQYCIFNKQYSKEEYNARIAEFNVASFSKREALKKKCHEFWMQFPRKYIHEAHNTKVSGDYVYTSKNTFNSYIVDDMEDSKFCTFVTPGGTRNCYDFTHYGTKAELLYESLQVGNQASRILFTWFAITGVRELEYTMFGIGSSNLFGCVGLKKKKYCILNKQYSKEAYTSLRAKIIKHMEEVPYKDKRGNLYRYGEFFPAELSPFGYNETTAQEFFPLTANEAQERGFCWRDREKRKVTPTKGAQDLPDIMYSNSQDIINEVIECQHKGECNEQCTGAFRIIPQELNLYQKMNVPFPRLCPNCRYYQRMVHRNPLNQWVRQCQCKGRSSERSIYTNEVSHFHGMEPCPNEFETSYAPQRPEIVYCETCYNQEVA